MNQPRQKPQSTIWLVVAAVLLFRGINLVAAGLNRGYIWMKHGFPLDELRALNELTYPQWVRIGLFITGLTILALQLRRNRSNAHPSSYSDQ